MENYLSSESLISDLEHLLLSWRDEIRHTILIVDDNPEELFILKTILNKYDIISAKNGLEALKIINGQGENISIVITDQKMPIMEGTELLNKISFLYPHMIKILLTASADTKTLQNAINGCHLYRYILKPFDPKALSQIVECGITKYELSNSKMQIAHELSELFYKTTVSVAFTLDAKDQYTHGHSFRVALYSLAMAKALNLSDKKVEETEISGLLHDIGKIAIPESILNKTGKLTPEEYSVVKSHARRGFKMLEKIEKFKKISLWILYHHENFDGKGYPCGLSGKQIPVISRLLGIADSYDAMTSTRAYRKALSHEEAMNELRRTSGTQFDPIIVELFENIENEIKYIKQYPEDYCFKNSRLIKYMDVEGSLKVKVH